MSDDEDTFDAFRQSQLAPLPPVPANQGPPSIYLNILLDFAIQKTYHEITVKSNLLQSKSDLERKVEIVELAQTTRQLFIRLLAIVKWAKSAAKVDVCASISCFLNQQCLHFVEGADYLFQLSKEFLSQARLPVFQIPAAVDVLTLGTYPRLPVCLKTNFVSDEVLTSKEEACVLQRLNQVNRHRLIANGVIPAHYTISNGSVTFRFENEFEASLTLLGESADIPWTLLNLKILVQDFDIGDGADLVHPLQIHYLHQVVQARIETSANPISELCDILHTFCLSLHLDILFCQASKLIHERLNDNIVVGEYVSGRRLTICYWKNQNSLQQGNKRPIMAVGSTPTAPLAFGVGLNYKIVIDIHTSVGRKYLRVSHIPALDYDSNEKDLEKLSMDDLLCDTQTRRLRFRLNQMKERVEHSLKYVECRITEDVHQLEINLLRNSTPTEKLVIGVNLFSGLYFSSVDVFGKSSPLEDLSRILNSGHWTSLKQTLIDLRVKLFIERCRKAANCLPLQICDSLSSAASASVLRCLSKHRMFLRFNRYENYYLILNFMSSAENEEILINYFLLNINSTEKTKDDDVVEGVTKSCSMVELDGRLLFRMKKPRNTKANRENLIWISNLVNELTAVVSSCEQRIPFMLLCEQFDKKGVKYQSFQMDDNVGYGVLKILGFSKTSVICSKFYSDALWRNVLSCSVRLVHDKNRLQWTFEWTFVNVPVNVKADEDGVNTRLFSRSWSVSTDGAAKCCDEFMSSVCTFSRMDDLARRFAEEYETTSLKSLLDVKAFSYYKLVFSYGPRRQFGAAVEWRCAENSYHLSLAALDAEDMQSEEKAKTSFADNPNTLTSHFLQSILNETKDLSYVARVMNETWQPLAALQQLPQLPTHGAQEASQFVPYSHLFAVFPLNEMAFKVTFRLNYALEIICLTDGYVAVRDAKTAFGNQVSKIVTRFSAIIGLKAFFTMYEKMFDADETDQSISENTATGRETAKPASPIKPTLSAHDLKLFSPSSVPAPSPSVAIPQSPMTAPNSVAATAAPPSNQAQPNPSPAPQLTSSQFSTAAMTPSPAPPASNAGLFTPSPSGPHSNTCMLMTPSPAVPQPSPAAAQFPGSQSASSPVGQVQSPLSAISALNELASESKMLNIDYPSSWGEISGPPSAPSLSQEKEPLRGSSSGGSLNNAPSIASASNLEKQQSSKEQQQQVQNGSPKKCQDLTPNADVVVIKHGTLLKVCAKSGKDQSLLTKFLGSVSLFERLCKNLAQDKTNAQANALSLSAALSSGQLTMKLSSFDCKFYLDSETMTELRLKVVDATNESFTADDQRIVENYFSSFVVPMYNPNALSSFVRLLSLSRSSHSGMLKSVLSLLKHQLNPNSEQGVVWHASLCMTMPPPSAVTPSIVSYPPNTVVQPGSVAIIPMSQHGKVLLFWLKLTSVSNRDNHVILPLRYDGDHNEIQLFTGATPAAAANLPQQGPQQATLIASVNQCLLTQSSAYQAYNECCFWPAIRGLLHNLPLPSG